MHRCFKVHYELFIKKNSATNLFKVTLTDSLVSSLNIAKYGEYQLSFLSGIVKKQDKTLEDSNNNSKSIEIETNEIVEMENIIMESDENLNESIDLESKLLLDVAPAETIKFHRPVMVL